MSTTVSLTRGHEAATTLWPFFVQEFLRIMRGRLARLILALMIYALVMVPFIMEKPPAELLYALASWLGPEEIQTKLILFVWIDASMNKFAVILGAVLAGGIIVDERSRGMLDVLIAKPIRAVDYFTVKLAASSAAFASFYLFGVVGALVVLEDRQAGARPDDVRGDETKASAAPQVSLSPWLSTAPHLYTDAGSIAHSAAGSFKTFLLS